MPSGSEEETARRAHQAAPVERDLQAGEPRLSGRRIVGESWRLFAANRVRLLVLAAVIELPLVAIEVTRHVTPGVRTLLDWDAFAPVVAVVLLYGSLSHYLFAGVLERFVTADRLDVPAPTVAEIVRELPWIRLIVADVVLTAAVVIGLALFVVPGLLIATWFGLTLPLINLEGRSPLDAFGRSAELVRGHAWTVGWICIGSFAIPEAVLTLLAAATHGFETVAAVAIEVTVATLLLPIAALPIVVTTHDLIVARRADHPER